MNILTILIILKKLNSGLNKNYIVNIKVRDKRIIILLI